jgi:hypothetical protein
MASLESRFLAFSRVNNCLLRARDSDDELGKLLCGYVGHTPISLSFAAICYRRWAMSRDPVQACRLMMLADC